MGKLSRLKNERKHKVIHTTQLFGGRETAAEVHRRYAWTGGRCCVCNDFNIVVALSFAMHPKELILREPRIAGDLIMTSDNQRLPIWMSKYGPMVWYWTEYVCSTHQRRVEKQAAHLPSHILVEIDRGPEKDKVIGQVAL